MPINYTKRTVEVSVSILFGYNSVKQVNLQAIVIRYLWNKLRIDFKETACSDGGGRMIDLI